MCVKDQQLKQVENNGLLSSTVRHFKSEKKEALDSLSQFQDTENIHEWLKNDLETQLLVMTIKTTQMTSV